MSRNIGGDVNDLSYRYKMPRMITKVEGRGNGIKTRLVNVADVARAVHRDPAYITKWFGCELGAQSKINHKELEYIVNGAHDSQTFEGHLDNFIEKYVLCPKCRLPETDLTVKKKTITATCNACGNVSDLDSNHRVAIYIIKNPPKESDRGKVKAKKTVQKREDELAAKAENLAVGSEKEAETWATDVSNAAVEERMAEADGALRDLIQVEEEEPDTVEGKFAKILNASNVGVKEKYKQIRSLQKSEKIGNIQRTTMMFDAIFSDNILEEMAIHADLVRTFCSDDRTLKSLMSSLEGLVEANEKKLLPRICDILQGFFEFEFVPEEVLLNWIASKKHKYEDPAFHAKVKKASAPFFEWLQAEESESDEGEEEEEEEEEFVPVPADAPAPVAAPAAIATTAAARRFLAAAEEDSESEIDLDDL